MYPTSLYQRYLVNPSYRPSQVAQLANLSLHRYDTPPPLSFSLSPSPPFGGDGGSSSRPGLVGTIHPPILRPPLCVKTYPPQCDDGNPISYIRVSSYNVYVGQDVGMIKAGYGMEKHCDS